MIEGEQLLNYEEEAALLENSDPSKEMLGHSVEISLLKKMPNVKSTCTMYLTSRKNRFAQLKNRATPEVKRTLEELAAEAAANAKT